MGNLPFPEELRRDYAKRNITPGNVLYLNYRFRADEPFMDKYFIIVDYGINPYLIKINSDINQYIYSRKDLLTCQLPILKEEYQFLQYDSYIDCSQAHNLLSKTEIIHQIMESRNRWKGKIKSCLLNKIKIKVENAPTLTPHQIAIIHDSIIKALANYSD